MYEKDDIIQRIYFNLQWGQGGGDQPNPGGSVAAQTGDPLLIFIFVLCLVLISIGIMCFIFRKQIVETGKSILGSESVVANFSLATKISLTVVMAVAIALCSLVIITGSAYAANNDEKEWNQFTSHIQATAYLDENTGDITFDIPKQTLPYKDSGFIAGMGASTHIDSLSLIHAWWDLYFDDYCAYSYHDMPSNVVNYNALVNNHFDIKMVAHNVDINELRPYIGTNFFEFFYHTVDTKYFEGGIENLLLPVDISDLTIVDQSKFDAFCSQNGWQKDESIGQNCYTKEFGIKDYSTPLTVITNPWDALVNEGILKLNNNQNFSKFYVGNCAYAAAPIYTLLQCNDSFNIGQNYAVANSIKPLFTSKEMFPYSLSVTESAVWTDEGLRAAEAEGWMMNEEGLMTKYFSGDTQLYDIMCQVQDSWFDRETLHCVFWSFKYGTISDMVNIASSAFNPGTINYWRTERIKGHIVDENGCPMKNVMVRNNISVYNPDIKESLGIYIAECDITDDDGYYEFYYPIHTTPVVYCDSGNLAGVVPDVISDFVTITDFSPHNLGTMTAYKCAYLNVSEEHTAEVPEVECQYVTKDKDGKEHIFYSVGLYEPIRVPANSKGFVVTDNPDYTFAEADQKVTAPGWGKTLSVKRTVIPRQATEDLVSDIPTPDLPDNPIEPDPIAPDPIMPEPETPALKI